MSYSDLLWDATGERLTAESFERYRKQGGGVVEFVNTVEMVRAAYGRAGVSAEVEPFLYDMGRRLRQADVIVCRAGATTLAEITAAGKAAILIPLPTATDDHQRRNAEALRAAGAAEVIDQKALTGELLVNRILALAADKERRVLMSAAARRLARPDAADRIVDAVLRLSGRRAS